MRKKFFDNQNLASAYAFWRNLCRKGNLPSQKFKSMLKRADRKRVWAYVDIPLWSIPYVLLTLENFEDQIKKYDFHFTFNKPTGSNISALWRTPEDCKLVKFFSNNGRRVITSDNPYLVSKEAFDDKCGDTSWITENFIQSLKL